MKTINTEHILSGVYAASEKILEVYATNFSIELKSDKSPVTLADKLSSNILVETLNTFGYPVISEEDPTIDYSKRKDSEFIWLVDPLDGTREFINKNGEFCINIALIQNGTPVFGLIASPVEEEIIFGGQLLSPAFIKYGDAPSSGQPLHSCHGQKAERLMYSRSHIQGNMRTFFNRLQEIYGEIHVNRKGSALKFIDLVMKRAQFYPRMAPSMEWDTAAGDAIYSALGGEVLNFSTFEPLRYNKASLYNEHFIAKPTDLIIK